MHIAIAGGGIAGLTTGLALARRGVTATVFERACELEEVGAGLQVSPNAWRVLERLGLDDELRSVSNAPEAICIRSARDGATLATIPLGRAAEARWGAPYRVVHRADLQTILERAARKAGVEIRLGSPVAGFASQGSSIEIDAQDGAPCRFDGLIGADGLWSAIRRQVAGDTPPRQVGKVAWRTTIPAGELPGLLESSETGLWLGRDAHLVQYGVRGGSEINIVAVVSGSWTQPGWSAPGDPAEIVGRFESWPSAARALVRAPAQWDKFSLADRPATRRWGSGAVTLAGDAAHPMLPFLAQGAAMGIEDAHVLAACLGPETSPAAAFRRYESLRMDRTARVQRTARRNGDIYHLGGLAARARDLALSVLGPQQLMAQWDWLYGWRG